MPRKPKVEKQTITVVMDGTPVVVILHPPSGSRTSWYAYWSGLVASKTTGQRNLEDAIVVAENMVKNGGKRADLGDTVVSDDEFEQIQRVHFGRKQDPAAKARAEKSLESCLTAIAAFSKITGLQPVTTATADDCAAFQLKALTLPKNWRQPYPKGKKEVECLSANTVLKWSRSLQAAFERANRNALKRKCVRGVVDEKKLLTANPWNRFTWIEGKRRPIRQFDSDELVSFLDYLEAKWQGVSVAPLVAKTCLWSSGRRLEVMSLKWECLRVVGSEYHFQTVGKWGVEKWFRIPEGLYRELTQIRTGNPFVFGAYNEQLRNYHEKRSHRAAKLVAAEFAPDCLGDWFYERIVDWSKSLPKGHATTHIFRKTTLQYARRGEDLNRQVAFDARVSESVMMTHYVKETDEEMRQASNRTFYRVLASFSQKVAANASGPLLDEPGRQSRWSLSFSDSIRSGNTLSRSSGLHRPRAVTAC